MTKMLQKYYVFIITFFVLTVKLFWIFFYFFAYNSSLNRITPQKLNKLSHHQNYFPGCIGKFYIALHLHYPAKSVFAPKLNTGAVINKYLNEYLMYLIQLFEIIQHHLQKYCSISLSLVSWFYNKRMKPQHMIPPWFQTAFNESYHIGFLLYK